MKKTKADAPAHLLSIGKVYEAHHCWFEESRGEERPRVE
jgi:hypothetical protein